jgi:sensor domain CHASE-containing protein
VFCPKYVAIWTVARNLVDLVETATQLVSSASVCLGRHGGERFSGFNRGVLAGDFLWETSCVVSRNILEINFNRIVDFVE